MQKEQINHSNHMTTSYLANMSLAKLKRIVDIREQIDGLVRELNELYNRPGQMPVPAMPTRKRRELTSTGRARIAAAQRRRWSTFRATRGPKLKVMPLHSRLSPEGKAKIAAVVRARWERFRAAKTAALQAAAKAA